MAASRGLSWRREEVLDLLDIWGDKKVQTSLRESHCNIEVFEGISKKMVEKGHQRTAEECRTKSKTMRQAYKKVLSHNSKSGNSPTTCPFFDILDRILVGDPSVKRRRTSQSLQRKTASSISTSSGMVTLDLQAISPDDESLGTLDEEEVNVDDMEETTLTTTPDRDQREHNEERTIETDNNPIDEEDTEGQASEPDITAPRKTKDIPPGAALSDLSPASRLALREEKRRKVSAMQKVGELMLRQSSREHRSLMESSSREHNQLMATLQSMRQDNSGTNKEICGLYRETLAAINEMAKSMTNTKSTDCVSCHSPDNHSRSFRERDRQDEHIPTQRRAGRKLFHTMTNSNVATEEEWTASTRANTRGQPFNIVEQPMRVHTHRQYNDWPPHNESRSFNTTCSQRDTHSSCHGLLYLDPVDVRNANLTSDCNKDGSEDGDSPDYVGTHVWGESPCDTQWCRDNYKPCAYKIPHRTAGGKQVGMSMVDDPCDIDPSNNQCISDMQSSPRQCPKKPEDSEDSQSLLQTVPEQAGKLRNKGTGNTVSFCKPSTATRVISTPRKYTQSSSDSSGSTSTPKKRKECTSNTANVLLRNQKRQDDNSRTRGQGNDNMAAKVTAVNDVLESQEGRSRRIRHPKIIFSPDI